MNVLYYLDNIAVPQAARIRSEALALDHTFLPGSTDASCGIEDLYRLSKDPLIDALYVCFEEGDAYYRVSANENEQVLQVGWCELQLFDNCLPDTKDPYKTR